MAKSFEKRADKLLAFARAKRAQCKTWTELSNLVFGPGGPAAELFPDTGERAKLVATDQFRKVREIIDELPEKPGRPATDECKGRILVRVPKTVHAALLKEAELEGISLNQLILSKLCVQLRAVV